MENLKREMDQIRDTMNLMNKKVDMMVLALMGSEIAKDGGIVRRVEKLESQSEEMLEEIELMKAGTSKMEIYQKILWIGAGALASGVFYKVLDLVFVKIK